jgi:hypothetical protein
MEAGFAQEPAKKAPHKEQAISVGGRFMDGNGMLYIFNKGGSAAGPIHSPSQGRE